MTDRKKLTGLVSDILEYLPWGQISSSTAREVADHLIANGVTFATDNNVGKWIPVTERLPEDDLPKWSKVKQIKVLTALKSDKGVRTVRSQMRYRCTWYSDSEPWTWKCSGSEITHWMPLPEPPMEVDNGRN